MQQATLAERQPLDPLKFRDPDVTAKGEKRAVVVLSRLRTLWFNTGSLCNIACKNCYMDSSPENDRLAYLSLAEFKKFLDEIEREDLPTEEIAFTGGEPFMNKDLPAMLGEALEKGYRVLVLTNAMKPMANRKKDLLALKNKYGPRLSLRVSMDHYTVEKHEGVRGRGTWKPMIRGLSWLAENDFRVDVAGRTLWRESDEAARAGYRALFAGEGVPVDADDPGKLVLFPEMDAATDVPEITTHCWDILGVAPETMMCASSRMIVKRKGAPGPVVMPCTLLPYDPAFELGATLSGAAKAIKLNHPHCAKFCVLGGGACSLG